MPEELRTLNDTARFEQKLSTIDILVPLTIRNAAKCDTQCKYSESSNILERKLRSR